MTPAVGGCLHPPAPRHIHRRTFLIGKELFGAKRAALVYVRGAPTEARR